MGTEHSLLNLAPHLAERGVRISLAAQGGGELEARWTALGFDFFPLDLPTRSGVRPNSGVGYNNPLSILALVPRTVQALLRLARVVRAADADVIHSNSLITHVDCAVVGRMTRTPVLVELHDIVGPGPGRSLLGAAVRLASMAVAISTAVQQQLPRWAARRSRIVPQGIDTTRFRPGPRSDAVRSSLGSDPSAPIVAAVGRVDPEKGLQHLIGAVTEVRRAGIDVQLAVVGSPSKDDGTYLSELRATADESIPGACRFVPAVDDVASVLRSVDVLACPSLEEPFGLIILEAQACGIPVVASASGGPLDFITHRQTGMLAAPSDDSGLAEGLIALLEDRRFRDEIARNALHRIRADFTIERRADLMADAYREVVRS